MKVIIGLVDGKRVPLVLPIKQCRGCSLDFQPLTQKSGFCSKECRRKWSRELSARRHDKKAHGGKREELIQTYGLKCSRCGKEGSSYEIVAHHITFNPSEHEHQELLCRACHCKLHHSVPKKNVTKEDIEKAVSETGNLEDACKILGINRSSLYWKRKKFGLDFSAKFNEKVITKEQIEMALKTTNNNKKEAAKFLGLDKSTLYDKLHKFGLIKQ